MLPWDKESEGWGNEGMIYPIDDDSFIFCSQVPKASIQPKLSVQVQINR